MGFDGIAPFYRVMEALSAGGKLQSCRVAHLAKVRGAAEILILGEGNGRFLAECRRAVPEARITCVDASARMLELARRRVARTGLDTGKIRFIQADALEWAPPDAAFDLIVTHFFLDCFRREQLEALMAKLAGAGTAKAEWLLADFAVPGGGLGGFRARIIHRLLYGFFRVTTGLAASHLTPPDEWMAANGFVLRERNFSDWGLLHSDRWARGFETLPNKKIE